jgi:anti-sigma regulatory factor (Ser/Thr protein kinase)
MNDEHIKLHYDIIMGDFIKGGEASSNVKKAFLQLGIKNEIIKRVCVACYEAEMNMVIHSLGGILDLSIYEDRVEIMALDEGPGIQDIKLAMTEGYSTASETAREMGFGAGMGLPNMKKSSDIFEIFSEPGKYTLVKMIINFD